MGHHRPNLEHLAFTRREFLSRCGMGMGAVGLAGLFGGFMGQPPSALANENFVTPLSPKAPHFPAKAKRVIHIFANGGPSHVDTFDPKPALEKYAGKPLPMENLKTERKTGAAFPSPFKFKKYGQSGIEVSELFPHVAESIDDIAVIRSMHADVPNHEPSLLLMNCGEARLIRPSMGSWVTYGLGTENQNLPGFIAMCPGGYPIQESQNWQSGFLPGVYQGTYIDTQHTKIEKLIENIKNNYSSLPGTAAAAGSAAATEPSAPRQAAKQDAPTRSAHPILRTGLPDANGRHRRVRRRRASRRHIREMYGDGTQARQILIARRLIERGVRFVQVWHGAGQPWDNHDDIEVNHRRLAKECDQAIGALLKDLKQRGSARMTRWSSGAASLGARPRWSCRRQDPTPERSTAGTTIITASRCGWPAAACKAVTSTARRMSLVFKPWRIRCTSMICTRRCFGCWASTMRSSPSATRAGIFGSPMCMAKL